MPYNRPPLTKELLRGDSGEEDLPLEDESWLAEQRVRLVSGRAVALDLESRRVTLSGGRELGLRELPARHRRGAGPTADPRRRRPRGSHPALAGPPARAMRRLPSSGRVIVIGSGFIGCEIAASLRARGLEVTLFSDEPAPNIRRLGPEAADEIAGWLRARTASGWSWAPRWRRSSATATACT